MDSGAGLTRADLDNFARDLVGQYEGTAGMSAVTITFNSDGSYLTTCEGVDDLAQGIICPFRGLTLGRYQLTDLSLSGTVSAETVDEFCGAPATSTSPTFPSSIPFKIVGQFKYMTLNSEAGALTFVRSTDSNFTQVLQGAAQCGSGLINPENYVVLQRIQ